MLRPESGPYLFDTSAESWLSRNPAPPIRDWLLLHLRQHTINVAAVTVAERIRGYAVQSAIAPAQRRAAIEAARLEYLRLLGQVRPLDRVAAIVAGEIMALLPNPPTPPRRSHHLAESRQDRLARWRFDCLIAATALVARLPLIHNNPADFEAIRSAIEISPQRFPNLGPLELVRCASVA